LGVFEEASVAIVLIGDARVEVVNTAFCRFVGHTDASALVGLDVSLLRAHPNEEGLLETAFVRKDGSTTWGYVTEATLPATPNAPARTMWIVTDITAERAKSMERHNGLLRDLATAIAHEVKNPLAGIRGAVDMIGDRMDPSAPEQEILKAIARRTTELNQVIDDVLRYARLSAPRLRTISLLGCLTRARESTLSRLALANVDVTIEGGDVELEADPRLLEVVFSSLMLNGIQALPGNGTVRMVVERHDDQVTLLVTDGGAGVPEELEELIFEPFFTTKARGAGLGLTTARRIIEAHGGTVELARRPDAGGAFSSPSTAPRWADRPPDLAGGWAARPMIYQAVANFPPKRRTSPAAWSKVPTSWRLSPPS
jgi:signal transduction histidine kinase